MKNWAPQRAAADLKKKARQTRAATRRLGRGTRGCTVPPSREFAGLIFIIIQAPQACSK